VGMANTMDRTAETGQVREEEAKTQTLKETV
jgi:hypothetical protein